MKSLKLFVFFACAVLSAACEDDPVGGGRRELKLTADTSYVAEQETVQLRASVGSAAASGTAYRSLNAAVATVDASGLVTGRSVGVAGIVAEAAGLADTIQIHVTPSPRNALATGAMHTCVLDVDGKAHCLGDQRGRAARQRQRYRQHGARGGGGRTHVRDGRGG